MAFTLFIGRRPTNKLLNRLSNRYSGENFRPVISRLPFESSRRSLVLVGRRYERFQAPLSSQESLRAVRVRAHL